MSKNCDICRENKATVHLKGILNEKVVEIEMCEDCAGRKGVELDPGLALIEFMNSLPGNGPGTGTVPPRRDGACRECGMTLSEIKQKGRFGCEKCYANFGEMVASLLEHIHGHRRHCGKKPGHAEKTDMKKRIEKAVQKEDYELAAILRDEMNKTKP